MRSMLLDSFFEILFAEILDLLLSLFADLSGIVDAIILEVGIDQFLSNLVFWRVFQLLILIGKKGGNHILGPFLNA